MKPMAAVTCTKHLVVCKSTVYVARLEAQKKVKQNGLDVRCRIVSRDFSSQENIETNQNARTRGDLDHFEIVIKQQLKHQHRQTKVKDFNGKVPVPRVSVSLLRGWGNGGPNHNDRLQTMHHLQKFQKLPANSAFFSQKSLRELGCNDDMIQSLRGQSILRPSWIQALAFAPVIRGKSCIIADQSGSGKTLAYLLPIIQRLRQEELLGLRKSSAQNPQVIILVPTAELARQVLSNCRLISKFGVPFRSMVATGGFRQRTQLESLHQNLDVLIATPGRFMFLIKEGLVQLTNLRCVVFDEVDLLFNNEEYEPVLQSLTNSSPVTTQYLFVTATLPVDIYNKLLEIFPDCELIMGPGMHHTSTNLEEIILDCSGDEETEKTPDTAFQNKRSALLQLVEQSLVSKTIIFCNKIETCRKVENSLNRLDRKGIHMRVLPFHAAITRESQLANMEEFCSSQVAGKSLFLVCTDRASRGIDFSGVDHVILFDFPRDPSEYLRRVGRTARGAGGKGKAFIFVVGKQVSLARRIIERNKKGHPLHDVPSV
ncbi:DEAD-box ATP-dependent RNA helicase 50 [Diospyros lotus]|uniref:DEAD-box ATP-dependent RNA helicase 50 n=1 Tax=Diospyros lotus TaxID=55363 RepID=UPI002255D759|nr:DEAD-box ATP-dependent RNA helicase 50 [Diospyros lotus]